MNEGALGESTTSTPLMKQYWEIKNQHQDAILLFRLGDFYEMFFQDAEIAAPILDIALTSRDKSAENPIPLCGVPHHSVSGYIAALLDRGHKVAICEQVEDPKVAKGIVRREVVRVITPGLRTGDEGLEPNRANPIVSLFASPRGTGLASIDVASGQFFVTHFATVSEAEEEIWRLSPRELILPEFATTLSFANHNGNMRLERIPSWVYEGAERKVSERFSVASLDGFGIHDPESMAPAAAALLYYIESANRTPLPHLHPPKSYSTKNFVQLDPSTREHLEIFRAKGDLARDRSLVGVLDETRTAMGARRLREWFQFPLRDRREIEARLASVEEFTGEVEIRERIRSDLAHIYDLERLIGKIASRRALPRDLVALRSTLERSVPIRAALETVRSSALQHLREEIDPHVSLAKKLGMALVDEPPPTANDGDLIRSGFHTGLDELRSIAGGGREWIAGLEETERARTGISSLKIRYNRVFGYFIEVTKSNLGRVPSDYTRKQTLAGSERFTTPELKVQEEKILGAEEKITALEFEIFEELRKEILEHIRSIQRLADALADLDVFASLARAALAGRYVRPQLVDLPKTRIRAGRHPVVERFLTDQPFVPNDIDLDTKERQLIILTGPNMAGKSTIMRQVALITLMAQVGSFVPAEEAEIGMVDRIFTRVGASDDLARGQSTFMVEMSETANILRNATPRSLILLDEIGRGTSTFDGLAIAWAVAEDLHDRIGARTIFATHYHELTDLARLKSRARNMNVSVKEWGDKIIFLHALAEGAVNRSYGIDVARLAGVPESIVTRAREILANLERSELDATGRPVLAEKRRKGSVESTPQIELGFHSSLKT